MGILDGPVRLISVGQPPADTADPPLPTILHTRPGAESVKSTESFLERAVVE